MFLIPLSWWANRGCNVAGIDPLYHTTLWVHERLGWFIAGLAAASVLSVIFKIVVARSRLMQLLSIGEATPPRVTWCFKRAADELRLQIPRVVYLDVPQRIAATVFGPVILISRGFIAELSDGELTLVARHELVHAAHRDARSGVAWHLAFAALLLPGFEPLERRLHARREHRANLKAAADHEEAYLAVLARLSHGASLCAGGRIGLEAAARRPSDRWLIWVSPTVIVTLAIALPMSHMEFMRDLPFLLRHHC